MYCGWWTDVSVLFVRVYVCPCVTHKALLTQRYLQKYLTDFHRTYINNALWDRDESVTFWSEKVKGQGHGGINTLKTSIYGRRHTVRDTQPSSYKFIVL